jgi:hypothetical protein
MCVAIWKESGVEFLDRETYQYCWTQNDDGGSISYWNKEKQVWNVIKGLMTFEKWWEVFENMKEEGTIGKDVGVFIHFRVGTAGKDRDVNLTHPFPVTDDKKFVGETMYEARNIVAHNGTIGSGTKDGNFSDTMLGVLDYVEPLWDLVYNDKGEVINKKLEFILKECLDTAVSRWFVANGPYINLYGPWIYEKQNQTWFSNNDYENPWEGYGGAYSGVGFMRGNSYPTYLPSAPTRFLRTGDIKIYLTKDGDWSFEKWKELNGPGMEGVVVEEKKEKDDSGLLMAVVDEDGTIIWDEHDEEDEEESMCCPDCVSEETYHYEGLNLANRVCHSCGAFFDNMTGEVFGYDEIATENIPGICMYCDHVVLISADGFCSVCNAKLDRVRAHDEFKDARS